MPYYLHHVPGRVRLKTPVLKRSEPRAQAVQALIFSQPGVKAANVNVVTGSIVIQYDSAATTPQALLEVLRREGCAGPHTAIESESIQSSGVRFSAPTNAVTKVVAGFLVERLVETALVAVFA